MHRFKAPAFLKGSLKRFIPVAHCDDSDGGSLIDDANTALADKAPKIKPPVQYLDIHDILQRATVHTFDGFRVHVQKQLNLNVVVSHFYWIGSQQAGPIYSYRLILANDEKMLNVGTDMDFNLEGEIKHPVTDKIAFKGETQFGEQAKTGKLSFNYTGETATGQFQCGQEQEPFAAVAYMQALNPHLQLGGRGKFTFNKNEVSLGFGGIYDKGDNQIVARYSKTIDLMYMRRVNPNRVHLYSYLTFDPENKSKVTVAAEYQLKQSKINMSIDSHFTIRSTVETSIAPNVQMAMCAQVSHAADQYLFGTSIAMG